MSLHQAFGAFLYWLWSGCLRGRVAKRVIALWHIFSIRSSIGSIATCASNESVGEVMNHPITASVPACCTVASFFMALIEPFLFPFAFLPCMGVHQMLMPYRIVGSATLTYNFLAPFRVSPQVSLVRCWICDAHFEPFLQTCASCGPQLRCWSRIILRYFALAEGSSMTLGSTSRGRAFLTPWCAKSISANLLYSIDKLCDLDQFIIPLSLVIILASSSCASSNVLANAVRIVSSIIPLYL